MAKIQQQRGDREQIIKLFVKALGWGAPRRFEHSAPASISGASSKQFVFYESGSVGVPRTDCFLQLNELDELNDYLLLSGAVYAIRYRICTGWHLITLQKDERAACEIAAQMSPWLGWHTFSSYAARRSFRIQHPETVGYSWTRIRQVGPPYFVVVTKRGGRAVATQQKSEACKEVLQRRN